MTRESQHKRGFRRTALIDNVGSGLAVNRHIRDFEAILLLHSKIEYLETISLIARLSQRVDYQYVDLIPVDAQHERVFGTTGYYFIRTILTALVYTGVTKRAI